MNNNLNIIKYINKDNIECEFDLNTINNQNELTVLLNNIVQDDLEDEEKLNQLKNTAFGKRLINYRAIVEIVNYLFNKLNNKNEIKQINKSNEQYQVKTTPKVTGKKPITSYQRLGSECESDFFEVR